MIASAENMRTLINDLLEFSRVTKSAVPFGPVDLNGILKQVLSDLELTIEETGTVINASELPIVEAIATQMKQLFLNLVTNAIKFHKPGMPPAINITAKNISPDDIPYGLDQTLDYCKINVADNGIGFEQEYASRIFQVFQRLHGKSEYPGSGIGLAICKKIVEFHNGIIYAESAPEAGATFSFILPLQQKQKPGQ
jgi:hypothetical protein